MLWDGKIYISTIDELKKKNSACNQFIIKKAAKMSEREKAKI